MPRFLDFRFAPGFLRVVTPLFSRPKNFLCHLYHLCPLCHFRVLGWAVAQALLPVNCCWEGYESMAPLTGICAAGIRRRGTPWRAPAGQSGFEALDAVRGLASVNKHPN